MRSVTCPAEPVSDQAVPNHPFGGAHDRGSHRGVPELWRKASVLLTAADQGADQLGKLQESFREDDLLGGSSHAPSFEEEEKGELGILTESLRHRGEHGEHSVTRVRRVGDPLLDLFVDRSPALVEDRLQQAGLSVEVAHELGF